MSSNRMTTVRMVRNGKPYEASFLDEGDSVKSLEAAFTSIMDELYPELKLKVMVNPKVKGVSMSSGKIQIATWGIASDPETLREGNYLYYRGVKYRCPRLSSDEILKIIGNIEINLGIKCSRDCRGLRKVYHSIFRRKLHEYSRNPS